MAGSATHVVVATLAAWDDNSINVKFEAPSSMLFLGTSGTVEGAKVYIEQTRLSSSALVNCYILDVGKWYPVPLFTNSLKL